MDGWDCVFAFSIGGGVGEEGVEDLIGRCESKEASCCGEGGIESNEDASEEIEKRETEEFGLEQ